VIADGGPALFAHPDSNLWLHAPARASHIEWNYGIVSGAYEKKGDKTDGVEFTVAGVAGGATRVIFHRVLDPVNRAADRGRSTRLSPISRRLANCCSSPPGPFKAMPTTGPTGGKST